MLSSNGPQYILFFSDGVFEAMPLDVTCASAAAALALPFPGMQTYADVCRLMPTYAAALALPVPGMLTYAGVCWRMLAYAGVCWRMLTYADACSGGSACHELLARPVLVRRRGAAGSD